KPAVCYRQDSEISIRITIKFVLVPAISRRIGGTFRMSVGRPAKHLRLGPVLVRMLAILAVLSATAVTLHAADAKPLQASIVIDAATGPVPSANNREGVTQPASLTKMMTMYLLFDALKRGKLRLSDTIPFSDYAASRPATNLAVDEGDTIGVETAIL